MFTFKKNKNNENSKLKIISTVLTVTTTLTSGCSLGKDILTTDNSDNTSIESSVTETEFIPAIESSMYVSTNSNDHDFEWSNDVCAEFDEYVKERCYNTDLTSYINMFGFTNELNAMLTDFVNQKYNKNYDVVTFSEVKYFRSYVSYKDVGNLYHAYTTDYDKFCKTFLNSDKIYLGAFNNKLIMSYLVQNKIPFGSKIPVENLKYFYGDNVYIGTGDEYDQYLFANPMLGNYDANYKYSKEEYLKALLCYNVKINVMAFTEGIPTRSFFYGDPQDEENTKKAIEAYNSYLKQYFGDGAWQIGKVPTEEDYIKIFGEKPLDLSYLNTPVKENTPIKGEYKVRVDYNSSYDNYDVYYTEPNYGDESSGRGRRM